jgi:hypothetical protein
MDTAGELGEGFVAGTHEDFAGRSQQGGRHWAMEGEWA